MGNHGLNEGSHALVLPEDCEEEMNGIKKSVVLSHQGTKSNFCALCVLVWVCRGENR